MNQQKNKSKLIAIITMCFILGMISFVTNMAAPFGTIWGHKYEWAGMMGNMMVFAAYLFMGIPAGKMLVKIGYKKTVLAALIIGIIGLGTQYLSSIVGANIQVSTYANQPIALNLIIYLLGAFICGFCVCMLNTAANPMLNTLGSGGNRGNQLIQIGGTLSSLVATLTPFFVGLLVGTVSANTSMSDVTPLLFIGIAVFIISFLVILRVEIPEPHANKQIKYERSPLAFRHCLLGVLAIFCYVGAEIGIPAQLNFYISDMGFVGSAIVGGSFAAAYWGIMMIGRACSSAISGKFSTRLQMIIVSSTAILLILAAIFFPESIAINFKNNPIPIRCFFLVAVGLFMSVMWGGIFNLSVEGLGKYTEAASGLFMTMVVGGGILPLLQDFIAKSTNHMTSYWLVIGMLGYILFYSLIGCKNVNKDIPVE